MGEKISSNSLSKTPGKPRTLTWDQETEIFRRYVLLNQTASGIAPDYDIGESTVGLIADRVWKHLADLKKKRGKGKNQ